MCDKQRVTLPELITTAVCVLQEKNWVSACEIAEYVANKRGCKLEQIEGMIKIILCKAKNANILCEKKGMYRIKERYDDLPEDEKKQPKEQMAITISDDSDSDDNCDDNEKAEPNPCVCLKLSKDELDDDEEDEQRCGASKAKKRKCR